MIFLNEKHITLNSKDSVLGAIIAPTRDNQLFICSVLEGGEAKIQGIKQGDILIRINGLDLRKQRFSSIHAFYELLHSAEYPILLTFATPKTLPVPKNRVTVSMQTPLKQVTITKGTTKSSLSKVVAGIVHSISNS